MFPLTKKTALTWFLILGAIELAAGFAGGAEYLMRKWDAADTDRAAEQKKLDDRRADITRQNEAATQGVLNMLYACQANFQGATVLYEPAPGVQLSLGLRGLGVAPSANQTPRWVIPAKIKPKILAGTQGEYFYVTADNLLDGPYLPEVAKQ
jgi:hypothetical protein